jgi:hypothetical protein
MYAHIEREILERYVRQAYRQRLFDRILSIFAGAAVTVWLKVWSWPAALLWALIYAAGEFAILYSWRIAQPALTSSNARDIQRRKSGLIAAAAILAWVAALPCFLTPQKGLIAIGVGLLLSTGTLMVIAAQHSLDKRMAFWTAPPMVIALLMNLWALESGAGGWVLAVLGLAFVGNAFGLARGNASTYQDLIRAKS